MMGNRFLFSGSSLCGIGSSGGDVVSEAGRQRTIALFGEALTPQQVVERICGDVRRGGLSVVLDYTPADWDRGVRHGVAKSGRPTVMPAVDFQKMSDRELSDIVAYLGSLPPVDNQVAAVDFGPVGTVLVAK